MINQTDVRGGAGIAAYRLHEALIAAGVESRMLVAEASSGSDLVRTIPSGGAMGFLTKHATMWAGLNYVGVLGTGRLAEHPWLRWADVLHFHNLHGNYFNYRALPRLTAVRPAVWTLHDMWALTGHCSYSHECQRWQTGCGQCPHLDTYPRAFHDLTAWEWRLKRNAYRRSRLTLVSPSAWLADLARQSILAPAAVEHIANGLDTEVYRPHDRGEARTAFNLPAEVRVLMLAAADLNDRRKGGDLLRAALERLPVEARQRLHLLVMGSGGGGLATQMQLPVHALGYLDNDRLKAMAYSAADLFVLPTRADNLPVVIQEAMACAVPVVSFAVGGVGDMVRPGRTGYLARPEDADDLSGGIAALLADDDQRRRLGQTSREVAVQEYGLGRMAERYRAVYERTATLPLALRAPKR